MPRFHYAGTLVTFIAIYSASLLYLSAFLLITQRKSGNVEWKNCSPMACCGRNDKKGITHASTNKHTRTNTHTNTHTHIHWWPLTYFGAISSPSGHSCLIISQKVVTTPFNFVRNSDLFLPLRALTQQHHTTSHSTTHSPIIYYPWLNDELNQVLSSLGVMITYYFTGGRWHSYIL